MNFSLKAKILSAYGMILLLIGSVLFFSIGQLKLGTRRLSFLQSVYIPTLAKLNSLSSMSHLSNSIDFAQLKEAPSLYHLISNVNPNIFEQELNSVLQSSDAWVYKNFFHRQDPLWKRIRAQLTLLENTHSYYVNLLQHLSSPELNSQTLEEARKQTVFILNNTSHSLSDSIRNQIQVTIRQESEGLVTTIALSAITLIISLLIAWRLLKSLRPIEQLKNSMTLYRQGDFKERAHIQSNDEIAALSKEFNAMADSIEKQQQIILSQERMATVGMMASTMSHEIRNPLNAMNLNLELLLEEASEPQKNKIKMISEQVDRLNQLVVSYLSRVKQPSSAKDTCDLSSLVEQLSRYLEAECIKNDIVFKLNIPKYAISVDGSKTSWEQILLNLCKNAMESLDKHGTFGIDLIQESHSVELSVWDKGKGMSQDLLLKIEEPFFSTKENGTGLGLSITRELLKPLHVKMMLDSSLNEGTRVTLHIPFHL